MNKKVLHVLEYDKIIALLADRAATSGGRALCEALTPVSDPTAIGLLQGQTADAVSRVLRFGSLRLPSVGDPSPLLDHLELGASLSSAELLQLLRLTEAASKAKAYGRERAAENEDSLDAFFDALEPLTPLSREISRCILAEDLFADDASPALRQIRAGIRAAEGRIHEQMNHMLHQATIRSYLQEPLITMRSGRYCFPVKAEYKSSLPGMVHDHSSSGSTLFIEPASVVELNNKLRELHLEEQDEIDRILAALSALAAENLPQLWQDAQTVFALDFIFARAALALDMKATAPVFRQQGVIRLKKARHPLLDPEKVVPIDLTLGEDFSLLIVTGPNTGGKTVSLKTCGLLALMGQSGLHIPAADKSELCVFDEIFADIGDEQSIEQSLSTFSSHMTNIVRTLRYMEKHPEQFFLVLLDELCAGTDPAEGAALAISILNTMLGPRVRIMTTTHYSELKLFALSAPEAENACCEFSVESLSPTYRLLIGVPGKSNAFAISRKLGLPENVITDARAQMKEEDQSFEDLLLELERDRAKTEADRLQAETDRKEAAALKERMLRQEEKLGASKEKILRQANEEAAEVLRQAKSLADETIRNFQKYGKTLPDMADMEQQRQRIGKELNARQKHTAVSASAPEGVSPQPKDLRIGDSVKIRSMNMTGTVYSLPNARGDLQVQVGTMRSNVNIRDLILIREDSPSKTKKSRTSGNSYRSHSKAAVISPEINLVGMYPDEAIAVLDKYLDDAYLSHLHTVRIVHGKGTGRLRQAVHDYLRRQSVVADYHLAEFGEGDAGVTLVNFRE